MISDFAHFGIFGELLDIRLVSWGLAELDMRLLIACGI
jgi:hypothetical protein